MHSSFSSNPFGFNPLAPPSFEIAPISFESDESFHTGVDDQPFDPRNILMQIPSDSPPSPPKLTAERVSDAAAPKPKKAKLADDADETSLVDPDEIFDIDDIDSDVDDDEDNMDETMSQGSEEMTSLSLLYSDETLELEDGDQADLSRKRAVSPAADSAFSQAASPSVRKKMKTSEEPLSEFFPRPANWPPNFQLRQLEEKVELGDGRLVARPLSDLVRHANFISAIFLFKN